MDREIELFELIDALNRDNAALLTENGVLGNAVARLSAYVAELKRQLENHNETDTAVAEWSKIHGTVHNAVPCDKGTASQIPFMPHFHAGNSAQCHPLPMLPSGATECSGEDQGVSERESNPVGMPSEDGESVTYKRVQKEHYAAFWDAVESSDFDAPSELVWLDTMPPDRYSRRTK